MRPSVPAVVAVAVVVAGCGGALGDDRPAGTEDARVAAPGVTREGVTDPDRLARAHAVSLENRSYTLRSVVVEVGPDGTTGDRVARRLRMSADRERFVFEQVFTGAAGGDRPPERFRAWSDGNVTFVAVTRGNRTTYTRYGLRFDPPVLTGREAVRFYFRETGDARVRRTTTDGRVAYRIDAAERIGAPDRGYDVRVTAVVDSFGFVRRISATHPAKHVRYGYGIIMTSLTVYR